MAEPGAPAARRIQVAANGKAAAVAALVMFGLATQTQSVWIQVVGAGLIGLLAVSFGALLRRPPFTLEAQFAGERAVGETLVVHLHVRNKSNRSTRPLRVTVSAEDTPLFAPYALYVDPLVPASRVCLQSRRPLTARGWSPALRADVEVMSPFGFFVHSYPALFEQPLFVAPPAVAPLELPPVLGAQADGVGAVGPGLDVRGVREWRPGDTARHVHWRSTARTGRLTVLDYGEPAVGCLGALVAGTAGEPRLEAALAVAASTARQAMADGVQVVVAGAGIERVTDANWHQMFARVDTAGSGQAVDEVLDAIGNGGVLVVAVGSGVPDSWRDHVFMAGARAGVRVLDCDFGLIS